MPVSRPHAQEEVSRGRRQQISKRTREIPAEIVGVPLKARCPVTGKISYMTGADALAAQSGKRVRRGKPVIRAYVCEHCRLYHLTSNV